MESNVQNPEGETPEEAQVKRGPLYDATRRVLLAGIGAVMLAQDEAENFVNRLVERGEMAEGDARRLVREVMDRRERLERERRERVAQARATAASRADVEALSARIAELTRQIEELKRQQGGQA